VSPNLELDEQLSGAIYILDLKADKPATQLGFGIFNPQSKFASTEPFGRELRVERLVAGQNQKSIGS
jgi:hypothetical protein